MQVYNFPLTMTDSTHSVSHFRNSEGIKKRYVSSEWQSLTVEPSTLSYRNVDYSLPTKN